MVKRIALNTLVLLIILPLLSCKSEKEAQVQPKNEPLKQLSSDLNKIENPKIGKPSWQRDPLPCCEIDIFWETEIKEEEKRNLPNSVIEKSCNCKNKKSSEKYWGSYDFIVEKMSIVHRKDVWGGIDQAIINCIQEAFNKEQYHINNVDSFSVLYRDETSCANINKVNFQKRHANTPEL